MGGDICKFQSMKRLNIDFRLQKVISEYWPTRLGSLWKKSFVNYPSKPGFFLIMKDDSTNVLAHCFVDDNLTPPIHIFKYDQTDSTEEFLSARLAISFDRRLDRRNEIDAFRLVNGGYDGLPGLTIDIYDGNAIICIYSEYWKSKITFIQDMLCGKYPELKSARITYHITRGVKSYASHLLFGNTNTSKCEVVEVLDCLNMRPLNVILYYHRMIAFSKSI